MVTAVVGCSGASCASGPALRLWFDRFKLKLPVFGPLLTKIVR